MLLVHITFDPNKAECHSLDEVFSMYTVKQLQT